MDVITLVYFHQDKSASTDETKEMTKVTQRQDKNGRAIHSIITLKPDCHVNKPLIYKIRK